MMKDNSRFIVITRQPWLRQEHADRGLVGSRPSGTPETGHA